jgi:nucleotide-binding universal stress UspA family protein
MPVKKVLVLSDGSEISRQALRYAVEICNQFDAELNLLTVIEPLPAYVGAKVAKDLLDAAEARMQNEIKTCSGYCETSGMVCRSAVRKGIPHDTIIDYAHEIDADLIILSTHGRSGIRNAFMGNVAEKVVRHADCPVMTIRPGGRSWDFGAQGSCTLEPPPAGDA